MSKTKIQWATDVWNPVSGCTKISAGCANCYVEPTAEMRSKNPDPKVAHKYRNGFDLTLHEHVLDVPRHWTRKTRERVFVCSMADLFHEAVPDIFLRQVFHVMRQASRHTFLVLSKRSERLAAWSDWPPNVLAGVTVESADYLDRVDHLRSCAARRRFLSLEPLLGPLDEMNLRGIDWAIIGGEKAPKATARPMKLDWFRSIRDQCSAADLPVFIKQITAKGRKVKFEKWPEDLKVRQLFK
jgi:protein gp37